MNNLLKKIDESIEFNSKERPHLPEINIGLYIAREIIQGEQLQLDSLIKQAIDNCFMTHKYEYPGMERGLCAGLRKQNGEGELTEVCKECKFNYIWEEENQN